MVRIKSPLVLLLFIAVAVCVPLEAQTKPDAPVPQVDTDAGQIATPDVSAPQPPPLPFAIGPRVSEYEHSIQVVPAEEMSRHDRDLEANAESSIQERAGFENLGLDQGEWTYQQLVCPALPNHLFLRYSMNEGSREMSMFSAAIPRNGEGKIRVIPIVRKGYSLFSPAPIGALTISAFNHIRAEENTETPADWLGTGLCYAALAGANPQAGQWHSESPGIQNLPATMAPTLELTSAGGAVIHFADLSTAPRPMEWHMTFDSHGKLIKATHVPAYVARYGGHTVSTVGTIGVAPPGTHQ
jgi:hypothetical protein